jgi:hypothetical protein
MVTAKEILIKRYYHENSRQRGNEIVRQFIIDRQLVLTGGLIIDFALKLKGERGIYEDYDVSDYDFFSMDNAKDASDLFNILRGEFENISLLPGIHPTTVKIFIYKDCIADITYATEKSFKEMEKTSFMYNGMKCRSVYLQYPDIHRALTYPYENEPKETINNRWMKDFNRFLMLYKHYPLKVKEITIAPTKSADVPGIISGITAIKYYMGDDKIYDCVRLMSKADYKSFLLENGKHIKDIKNYKSYAELLPERSEMKFKDMPITILVSRNKTSVVGNYVSLNFSINYAFSMFRITNDEWYNYAYSKLLEIAYHCYKANKPDKCMPSIIVYGEELENQVVEYFNENPDKRVPQVHIKTGDDESVIEEQIAKLPYDYEYIDAVYNLDGTIKN